ESLYNPFIYLAGFRSLVIGVIILLLISFVSYVSGTHYWGVVLPYFAKDSGFLYYFAEHSIHWLVLSLLLFMSGKLFSKSRIRFVDVLGTQGVAFAPFFIVPVIR